MRRADRGEVLDRRALGRATLARQLLLARGERDPVRAVERLIGVQAQQPKPAFVGLWSRVESLGREDVKALLDRRELVRATLMRCTLHLASAREYPALRAMVKPVLDRAMHAILKARGAVLDVAQLAREARPLLAERPRDFEQIRAHLAALHPDADERAMGFAIRASLPLVQVPSSDRWAFPTQPEFALAESWIGMPIEPAEAPPDELVRRYLAGYGPASVADAQAWTGLPKLRDAFAAVRDELVSFRDARGRELFDLTEAPRPGPDADAPVRFLPEWDNAIVARSDDRLLAEEHRDRVFLPGLRVAATLLIDGAVAGVWKIERKKDVATLAITPFASLPKKARTSVEPEGEALLAFVEPDAKRREIRID